MTTTNDVTKTTAQTEKFEDMEGEAWGKFINLVREGLPIDAASAYVGVSSNVIHSLMERPDFNSAIHRALAEFHLRLVEIILSGSKRAPKIAYELLKCRFPSEYNDGNSAHDNMNEIIRLVKERKKTKEEKGAHE